MALAVLEADRRRDRGAVRRVAGSRSSTGPGAVPLGEPSVVIVAVAPHRDAAFAAARYAIDETKARAPIWKAERFDDGARLDRRRRAHGPTPWPEPPTGA